MVNPILQPDIIAAFQCVGESKPMQGGEGRCICVGEYVFKPVENPKRYNWSCDLLLKVSQDGFRIPQPQRAKDGSFVFKGWGASTFEPGEHSQDRWRERFEVLRSFHIKLHELEHEPMPASDDYWSLSHEIAWQDIPLPTTVHPKIVNLIEEIFSRYQPLVRGEEIIHSDFSGNILFHDHLDPCIIDFSPAYGCIRYAEMIMVADATAWEDAPLEIVDLLPFDENYRQNLLRAINFRLIVAALFWPTKVDRFFKEYAAFKPILEVACT